MLSTSSSTTTTSTSQVGRPESPPRIRMSRFQSLHNYRPFEDGVIGDLHHDADDDKLTNHLNAAARHYSSPSPSRLSPYHHLNHHHNHQLSPNSLHYSPNS